MHLWATVLRKLKSFKLINRFINLDPQKGNQQPEYFVPAVTTKHFTMDATTSILEPVLDSIRDYSKTSLELLKLQSVDKTADILSTITSRLIFISIAFIFFVILEIALALWLGDLMGRPFYGFLAVAALDAVLCLIAFLLHKTLKKNINDLVINSLLN